MAPAMIRWIDVPEALARELGAPAATLPALVEQGRAAIVKENAQRTVYRVHLAGLDLHVKRCTARGWRARLRERLRPAKAVLEHRKLVAAASRQVPVIAPAGCGIAANGDSFLVTGTAAGAVPLTQLLDDPALRASGRRRMALAECLGRFLARVHNAGVTHPDLHPGNILVRAQGGEFELFLLDLHNARLGAALGQRAAMANLVTFNRWFVLRSNRSDRLRCWRAYVAGRAGAIDYWLAKRIEVRTWVSNQRFWRRRMSRCLGDNRRFSRFQFDGARGFAVSDWSAAELAAVAGRTDTILENARVLKKSRTSLVALCDLSVGGRTLPVVAKRFRAATAAAGLALLVHTSAARRSWVNGHAFLDCLLPTPRPLLLLERGARGRPTQSVLIAEYLPGAVNLREALEEGSTLKQGRIEAIARLIRDLHERGWSHRDLKAANILLARGAGGTELPWFVDLAGAARPWRLTARRRQKDIARLNASFHDLPALTRTDRLRFLRIYLNWNLHGAAGWKSWWRCIERRTRGKMAQNRRRGRPLA